MRHTSPGIRLKRVRGESVRNGKFCERAAYAERRGPTIREEKERTTMISRRFGAIACLIGSVGLVLLGCGDDDDGGGGGGNGESGLETGKKLTALSDAEKQQLCTWSAMVQPEKQCMDGSTVGVTAGECMSQFSSIPAECAATVGDQETCAKADACDLAAVFSACAPLIPCSSFGG